MYLHPPKVSPASYGIGSQKIFTPGYQSNILPTKTQFKLTPPDKHRFSGLYFSIYGVNNSFIHSLPGAEEAVDIEAIKGAPPTDMRNMVFEHYLSSYQTKNYPQLKSIVGDGNINGMKDLHDAVLSAYDSATSVSLKNAIRGQWNKFYNELDRKVRKKGDSTFPDASSLFRTNINTIK